jgi:hypothetical protein
MIFLAGFLIAAAIPVAILLAVSAWRRHRAPPELRGDWWSRFECEFRADADRAARRAANARRASEWRRSTGGASP